MGGQNIDTIMKDTVSGEPLFKTTTTLSSRLDQSSWRQL
jgi:hypothetical protein